MVACCRCVRSLSDDNLASGRQRVDVDILEGICISKQDRARVPRVMLSTRSAHRRIGGLSRDWLCVLTLAETGE